MKHIYLATLCVLSIFSAKAQLPGWSHNQPILIKENSGTQVLNYQLSLIINTQTLMANGELLTSGDDLRFTSTCDGGTNYNYWIESGLNTPTTKIWVKIDTLPAGGYKTIYMQYGSASATAQSAIIGTFFGPHSATDSVSGGAAGGVTNSQRGIRFAANEDLLVTAFGKNEPNGTTRYVTLFDNATQAILRQEQISGPAAQYSYQNISSPIWLTQGTQYVLEMYQGNTDGYYFGPNTTQIGQHLTYLDMRYCNGCDQNTFPQNYLNTIHYGYPDLWYFSKTNVNPEPTYTFEGYLLEVADDSLEICFGQTTGIAATTQGATGEVMYTWTGSNLDDNTLTMPTAMPASSETYYVTTVDACGITKNDSVHVQVNPLPDFSITASATLICEGETATLTVDGNYDFLWSTSETNDTIVVGPSVASVVATDAVSGCVNSDTIQVFQNVPLTATHNVDLCFGETLTVGNHTYSVSGTYVDTLAGVTSCDSIVTNVLTVAEEIDVEITQNDFTLVANIGADSYQWVDCNNGNAPISGATDSNYEVTANGSYAVAFTEGNCTVISDCITISTIGLEEETLVENIQVYPNPSDGVFTVTSSIHQTLSVLNAVGGEVVTFEVWSGEPSTIDLSAFASGVYYLKSKVKVVRLVVQ